MILELLTALRRAKRYRQISHEIAAVITKQSQDRVDKTLTDAFLKSTAQGSSPEPAQPGFNQELIEKVNVILSKENARRVRQWTEEILDQEDKFVSGQRP